MNGNAIAGARGEDGGDPTMERAIRPARQLASRSVVRRPPHVSLQRPGSRPAGPSRLRPRRHGERRRSSPPTPASCSTRAGSAFSATASSSTTAWACSRCTATCRRSTSRSATRVTKGQTHRPQRDDRTRRRRSSALHDAGRGASGQSGRMVGRPLDPGSGRAEAGTPPVSRRSVNPRPHRERDANASELWRGITRTPRAEHAVKTCARPDRYQVQLATRAIKVILRVGLVLFSSDSRLLRLGEFNASTKHLGWHARLGAGCVARLRRQQGARDGSAGGRRASGGQKVDPATAGDVKGVVSLEGAAPKNEPIKMNADPVCVKANTTPQFQETYRSRQTGSWPTCSST